MFNEIVEEREDGERRIAKAKQELEEERLRQERKRQKYINDMAAMVKANEDLENYKKRQNELSLNDDKKIAIWAKKKEDEEYRRTTTLNKRKQDRLNRTNFLIDRATEALKVFLY